MDGVLADLQAALHRQKEAGGLRKEAELAHAAGAVAAQEGEAAVVAGEVAGKLEAAGLKEEAEQVAEMQHLLESGEASGEDLEKAAKEAHELAAKLRAEEKENEAKEVEKLAGLLDATTEARLGVEAKEAEKLAHHQPPSPA